MAKLSKRLERIISFVDKGAKIADVGCDHGFVPIELIERNIASEACALDVNSDPLSKAKSNAERAGLSEKISFYLSNGLEKLPAGKADTVIIAGMGGILMARILDQGPKDVMDGLKTFILAPQSEYEHFRHYLADKGFEIKDEALIEEDGKNYPIIKAELTGKSYSYENEIYYRYGKILPERRDPVLRENLLNDISNLNKLLGIRSLPETRRKELEKEKRLAEELLHED
ncbi:MAG: tRNA (adenine(22)-N(1))-methyltransferase TrmK [Lachnospiraceae bacterium]|nr:tRNA (adenine(22)-N(1))-methyltransferase TrmK [Lachnospiraceae bacterium]